MQQDVNALGPAAWLNPSAGIAHWKMMRRCDCGTRVIPDALEPQMKHLGAEYVLVQAWKKIASYIR